ncbi:MAG: hypothetical protein MUF07_19090 [Steroidobacteraceae bacterium]|nr:hypothetical protein [Steroidobacteraceae bacterium]
MNDILNRFLEEDFASLGTTTKKNYRTVLPAIQAHFGTRIAADLSVRDFDDFMKDTSTPAMRDKAVALMSSVFTRAVRKWHWLNSNVCREVKRISITETSRVPEESEIQALRRIARPAVRIAMDLALLTGRTQMELLKLRWADVHADRLEFTGARSKKRVTVPMNPTLRGVLDEAKSHARGSEFVISTRNRRRKSVGGGYTSDGFRAVWQRTMRRYEKQGGQRFDFHDLREKAIHGSTSDVPPDVRYALAATGESLDVEHKDWLDLSDPLVRATVARHICALANYGGGFIVFGRTNEGLASTLTPSDLSGYDLDTFSSICKKYLAPAIQCSVYAPLPTANSDRAVVVKVPSHGSVPVCAIAR